VTDGGHSRCCHPGPRRSPPLAITSASVSGCRRGSHYIARLVGLFLITRVDDDGTQERMSGGYWLIIWLIVLWILMIDLTSSFITVIHLSILIIFKYLCGLSSSTDFNYYITRTSIRHQYINLYFI
jgi:hypothetical protein